MTEDTSIYKNLNSFVDTSTCGWGRGGVGGINKKMEIAGMVSRVLSEGKCLKRGTSRGVLELGSLKEEQWRNLWVCSGLCGLDGGVWEELSNPLQGTANLCLGGLCNNKCRYLNRHLLCPFVCCLGVQISIDLPNKR